ncbi:hypothetical protein [Taklimakanibacter deserti]
MKRTTKSAKARLAASEQPLPFALSLVVVSGLIGLLIVWFAGGH